MKIKVVAAAIVGCVATLTVAAWALEPLPEAKPVEPRNKKDVSKFGDAKDISKPGYYIYSTAEGVAISPIQTAAPQIIPDTPKDPSFVDVNDAGTWILFTTRDKAFLIRPDGSGKTELPVKLEPGAKKSPYAAAAFYHNGPFGDEVVYFLEGSKGRVLEAVKVDFDGDTPKFGKTRTLVDFTAAPDEHLALGSMAENRLSVAGNHIVTCRFGWAGAANMAMITIPDGGKGTASDIVKDMYQRKGAPKWECGTTMSQDGKVVAQNPGGGDKNQIPVEIGHKGPVVYAFMPPDATPLDTMKQLYNEKALAVCWVPESVRGIEGDWHHWYFSNNPEYLIGTNQGKRGMGGKVEDFKAIGVYLLHWPTGVFYRVSDDKTRARFMACHFFRDETRSKVRLPAGFGTAQAKPQPAAPKPAPTVASKPTSKPATPPIVVEVVARELSPVPTKDQLAVYKHISRFIRYDVTRVVSGKYDGKSIVVGHWSVQDGKFTPASEYKAGDKFIIACRRMEDEDGVTLAQRIDTIEDIDAVRFWAVSVAAAK